MYLENMNSPEDVKTLNIEEMKVLAKEIRETIITRDAKHGGHFGPNLGIVEATIALHYVFDSPKINLYLMFLINHIHTKY
ncbi:1-deoxy-D-xylulose-5-phosphate synthase [Fusobacterium necrophorum subsp. necrophorum]|nr:1-deoxy-D-xylulose-5-phosphate synthase [Fusobacterium necrophorum subsp. necrophorum]